MLSQEDSAALPPCRLFGGLVLDVKRKAPWFWSDFRDGLSLQCLASFLFLYCACMSPVITFGGLLGEATHGHIVSSSLSVSPQTEPPGLVGSVPARGECLEPKPVPTNPTCLSLPTQPAPKSLKSLGCCELPLGFLGCF